MGDHKGPPRNRPGARRAVPLLLIFFFLFSGCKTAAPLIKPAAKEGGEVYLYLQPFPQEAERVRFKLLTVSAINADGREYPLTLRLTELSGQNAKRQRLLASAGLPPGRYAGFSFQIKDAYIRVEEGEAALAVSQEPVKIDHPFAVTKNRALTLWAEFKYKESVTGGAVLSPVFSLFIPHRPPAGLLGYVTNRGSDNITVFDKKTGEVVSVLPLSNGPGSIVVSRTLNRAFVAVPDEDAVAVIDTATLSIINRVRLNAGDLPRQLALTPEGDLLLAANTGSDTLSIIDAVALAERARVSVGDGPDSVILDRTGRRAYVFNTNSNTISVLDISAVSVLATIPTESGPLRGQLNRSGDRLYIIHSWSPYLIAIEPLSRRALIREFVGIGARAMKVDASTDLLYLGVANGKDITIYDPLSLIPIEFIKTGGSTSYMTIDGEENNLHILVPERKLLMIVNLVSKKTIAEIDVGEDPYWVTMVGER